MSRTEELNAVLQHIRGSSRDIEASAIVSEDGLLIASALSDDVDEISVAALSAALVTLGVRTVAALGRGEIDHLIVKGGDGYVIVIHAGPHAAVMVLTRDAAKLGWILLELSRAAASVRTILG